MNSELIGNRYKFVQPLGEGGFGKTFVAEDLQRPGKPKCVIKLLKSSNDQTYTRLFRQEAETLEKLGNHDQIPRLLAYLEEEGEIYIVQELIRGNPLSAELHPNCHWGEKAVVELLLDCLQVIAFVHSFQVIHRDIKPDNIIRRDDGRLVLVDFGTVKGVQNSPELTVGIYSHGYTPNEQMSGRPKKNSDIYALGMIAIEALTGISPSMLEQDAEGEIIWRDQAPHVSIELADILSKMVKSYHIHRYQSVDQVFLDLSQIISNYSLTHTYSLTHSSIYQPKELEPTLVIEPTANQPISSEPTQIEPTANQPISLEATQIEPTANQPISLEATQIEPTANQLISLEATQIEPTANQPKSLEATQIEPTANQPKSLEATQIEPTANQPISLEATQVIESTENQPKSLEATQVIESTENQPKSLEATQVIESTENQPKSLEATQVIQSAENQLKSLEPNRLIEPYENQSISPAPTLLIQPTANKLKSEGTAQVIQPSSRQIEDPSKPQKTFNLKLVLIGMGVITIILIVIGVIAMKLFPQPPIEPPIKPPDNPPGDICPDGKKPPCDLCPGPFCPIPEQK